MIILGIHDGHNATAALLKNGKVVACASEERFTRLKNDVGHPKLAIDYVLQASNVLPDQIDMVALATKRTDPIANQVKRIALYSIQDYIRENYEYWYPLLYENTESDYWTRLLKEEKFQKKGASYNLDFIESNPQQSWAELFNEERIRLIVEQLNIPREKIQFVDHHTGHAYYAYYSSPINSNQKVAIVTADGWGDDCNATISTVENGKIREIYRTAMCNMARMYTWTTLLLGMKPHEHEYKVMGLAPYAKDYIRGPAYKIYKETLVVDGLDFKWKQKPSDMYFYFKEKFEGLRFDGIAAGVQLWLEELKAEWITNIMNHTGAEVLYYSGGLSMNVKANKVVAELPGVKNFYVPPSGGDESLAIGAAYVLSHEQGVALSPLANGYLGYEISVAEAHEATQPFRDDSDYEVITQPSVELIAELLSQGKVLARCVGKMEFGARALGNRSVICDPSKYETIRIINEKIKFRDFWMPFTPSILYERANDYLVNPKGLEAYYMTIGFDSTPLAQRELKAAIHPYDFTVRPQLVKREMNPDYYALIKAFETKTGIGSLLNTSLNLHGQPIVCTAKDATYTLVNSGLDGVILPEILILKKD